MPRCTLHERNGPTNLKCCYFNFAENMVGSKETINLSYMRYLQEAKVTQPLDLPVIEDKENAFQEKRSKRTEFGKRYEAYWENKEMIDISNNMKLETRTKLVQYTANFMEKTAQDITKENISPD